MRIVCIDDDKTFLTIYKKVLGKHSQPDDEIIVTDNPDEVFEQYENGKVDLLITDLVMPDMDGIEVLRKAKAYDPTTEIIVVTGQGSIDTAVEAMGLGARDYLTKPLNTKMLIEKIDNIREFINRNHEAEDYRFAKETIEDNAMKSVAEMEIKLDAYITLTYDIEKLVKDEISEQEKLDEISVLIKNTRDELV